MSFFSYFDNYLNFDIELKVIKNKNKSKKKIKCYKR